MSLVRIVLACLNALSDLHQRQLTIAETGTTYLTVLEQGETDLRMVRSTHAIADWISRQPFAHSFISIDLEKQHQEACKLSLAGFGIGRAVEQYYTMEGREGLRMFPWYDFVLLDSDSNAESTWLEWNEAVPRMRTNGIVVIDDAFKHESVNKARCVLNRCSRPWYGFLNQAVAIGFGPQAEDILRRLQP